MRRIAALAALVLAAGPVSLAAQGSYTEPGNRYTLDLPSGWRLVADLGNDILQFGTGTAGETVHVGFNTGVTALDPLCAMADEAFRPVVSDVSAVVEPEDMRINGNPARWMVYGGRYVSGSTRVNLYNLSGCIAFEQGGGGVYVFSILTDQSKEKLQESIEKIFETIRYADAPLTGVADRRPSGSPPPTHRL